MTRKISSFKFTMEIIMQTLGCNPFWVEIILLVERKHFYIPRYSAAHLRSSLDFLILPEAYWKIAQISRKKYININCECANGEVRRNSRDLGILGFLVILCATRISARSCDASLSPQESRETLSMHTSILFQRYGSHYCGWCQRVRPAVPPAGLR